MFNQYIRAWRSVSIGILLNIAALPVYAEPTTVQHIVRRAESLYKISREQLTPQRTWQDLARINQLANPQLLQIGQRLQVPVHWLAAKPASAQFKQVAGDVQAAAPNSLWQSVRLGTALSIGYRIKIGPNSSATLKFADGSELTLQPDTELALDTISLYGGGLMTDTRVRLQSGRVEVLANPNKRSNQRLEIITPSAITAVRGTQFMVEAQADQTITQTGQGRVELLNPLGSTMVSAGYGSKVQAGKPPLPPTPTPEAPALQQASALFTNFPIQFNAYALPNATGWVAQAGPGDGSKMLTVTTQLKTTQPNFDLGPLLDGKYQLRTWYTDTEGMPSQITEQSFEVQIPRQLLRPPVSISADLLTRDLQLQLPRQPEGKRYLLTLTQDAEGRQSLWYALNSTLDIAVPKQPSNQTSPYQLWIWVY